MSSPPRSNLFGISTRSFLPTSAWSVKTLQEIIQRAPREGFCGSDVYMGRASCRLPATVPLPAPVLAVTEVLNPRDSVAEEITRIVLGKPQSRGIIPTWQDTLLHDDGARSEAAQFALAETHRCPAACSSFSSPVSGSAYPGSRMAVVAHPDLGPDGEWMTLPDVAAAVKRVGCAVVFDTYEARRRVRLSQLRASETRPPVALPSEKSLEGISEAWEALSPHTVLVRLAMATTGEWVQLVHHRKLPPLMEPVRRVLQACRDRGIPVILEIDASMLAEVFPESLRPGLAGGIPADDVWRCLRLIRDAVGEVAG